MKSHCFKLKALLGLTLFLYFPMGFLIDFSEYTNITIVLLSSFSVGIIGSCLILPYMRSVFKLGLNEVILTQKE
ncbi:MAG: hypothetical protein HRT43_10765 [Campylobacteraceae bacterium]|nr:hypothetical protein [Campylobacteraceae bacterium]